MQLGVVQLVRGCLGVDGLTRQQPNHDVEVGFQQLTGVGGVSPIIDESLGSEPGPTPPITRPRVR